MKRIIIAVLITLITCTMTSYPLKKSDYTYRGISISWYDGRLLGYDDTLFFNKTMIESCLKKLVGDTTCFNDSIGYLLVEKLVDNMLDIWPEGKDNPLTMPVIKSYVVNIESIDDVIIKLANAFVKKNDELHVGFDYQNHIFNYKPIKKRNLVNLYKAVSEVKNLDSKDIIDIINLDKQEISLSDSIVAFDFDIDVIIRKEDSLSCIKEKIMQKYK